MQHKYIWLLLVGVGCSASDATDPTGSNSTEAFHSNGQHTWSHSHHHYYWDASTPTTTSDAGAPTDDASTTTQVDASTTTTQDSGTTTTTQDSGTTTTTQDSGSSSSSAIPAGWLYTQNGKIYLSNGTSGTQWMGRGVNVDDTRFCGYNNSLWMTNAGSTMSTMLSGLVSGWKPTFVRISLSMNSGSPTSSWIGTSQYKTDMTNAVNQLGASPGVYVLVTLRSDTTMTMPIDEATFFPTTATDAVYQAMVDSFANDKYVMFGIANEPGGNALSNATIRSGMDHAVAAIRAEENKLGVPHHLVAVQGNNWTSDISFYAQSPLTEDNVIYEVHGYPPTASSYTYSNIPVIIGEYGTLSSSSAFFADLESKQIPSTAWDFDPFSNCAPDLLNITQSATSLVANSWGTTVQQYLLAH